VSALAALGCGGVTKPANSRPERADGWFVRAQKDFAEGRVDDAHDAITTALTMVPNDVDVRTLGGRIALSRLDYAESIRLLRDIPGSEAQGLRGRAYWYEGDLTAAADELEAMLSEPDVRDDWAKSIASLARRGQGRTPFELSGALLASVEMAHVSQVAPYLVIPIEIDGEAGLAMVQTSMAEVVIDAPGKAEPSWVSMRFGDRLEVTDVPALAQDLSGVSKEVGAPIKALLGVNLLRHMNVTIDYRGHQFVARSFSAPPPPNATRVNLYYVRGGGMFVSTSLGAGDGSHAALLVDSSVRFPVALDEQGWQKAGISTSDLKLIPGDPDQKLREGILPMLKLGAFDVAHVPGVFGVPIADFEKGLKFDIDGIIGSPVLAEYRITFSDGGRMMWLEDDSALQQMLQAGPGPQGPGPLNMSQPGDDEPLGLPPTYGPEFGPDPGTLGTPQKGPGTNPPKH
jgi:hypothetical protein